MFRENQQIGYYTLVRFLGKGGFGEVWLAEKQQTSPPEQVAIKLPHGEQLDLPAVKDEIFNWILSGKHKNILPIIECESFGSQIAIVSEYAPDGSLKDLLGRRGRLAIGEAVPIITGILEGLAHLHQRKIIHRDLKPENILLQAGVPRLADFGISRLATVGNSTAIVLGTQAYMAPESFDGKRTAQTDLWAVGVILYLLLSGRLPFPQPDITALVGAIVMQAPPPLPEDVPPALQNIIGRALAKEAAHRYQSAAEMLDDLRRAFPNLGTGSASLPPSSPTQPIRATPTSLQHQAPTAILTAPSKNRAKKGALVLALAVFIAAVCGAFAYGFFKLVQAARQSPLISSVTRDNTTPGSYTAPPQRTITDFSPALTDEIFAAAEKEYGGRIKMTQFILVKSEGKFDYVGITAREAEHNEYFDTYNYNFNDRTVKKEPLKSPGIFLESGGKWFYKEDVDWQALPALIQRISAKAAELGEKGEQLSITVTRKFISFSPETFGDVNFELRMSGVRKDISLTADAKGANAVLKVD